MASTSKTLLSRASGTTSSPSPGRHVLPKTLLTAKSDYEIDSLLTFLYQAASTERGIVIIPPGRGSVEGEQLSYKELLALSEQNAVNLQKAFLLSSLRPRVVLLHFDNHRQSLEWLWAVVHTGVIPAISTPLSTDPDQRKQHVQHLRRLLQDPVCLTTEKLLKQYPELSELSVQTVDSLYTSDSRLSDQKVTRELPRRHYDDPDVLMLTSGSTGNAKAVSLTVKQIYSSILGKITAMETTHHSIYLNWIGLDHVANLVEVHLHSMLLGIDQVHVQAHELLADPKLFLDLISRYRVTHTFAPNFFLSMLDEQIRNMEASGSTPKYDLECIRTIMSGGEANVVATASSLTDRLHRLGASSQFIRMGYGLTEVCAACTYGVLDPIYEHQQKHEFASVGKPISSVKTRITTEDGGSAAAYELGGLEISGPAVFKEYFNDPISTEASFTRDGWFITGDRAYIDSVGNINLSGRKKEVLVINGVKYAPQDVESALEKAAIPGLLPSFLAVFSYRSVGDSTEGYCVLCGVDANIDVRETANYIARHASAIVGLRPHFVIPRPLNGLEKSSLGKLSRTKLQKQFEQGKFDDVKVLTAYPLRHLDQGPRQVPATETEHAVVQTLCEMLHLPPEVISTDQTIFELGVSSVSLFYFEKLLRKRLNAASSGVSIISFLSNPLLSAISSAIDMSSSRVYDPVAQIQLQGSKIPLWLVHPASGNALSFLPLARTMTDRPLYALTARGLRDNEALFFSLEEMADTYYNHVKKTQPSGPYAITGYSLGTTIAYEVARRLEANGDIVAFCGALDSPPHIIPLVEQLDWWSAAVFITFFFGLIPQDRCSALIDEVRSFSDRVTVIEKLLEISDPRQRHILNMDAQQLLAIVDVSDNYGSMLKTYHPRGSVLKVDVFYCVPLQHVESTKEKWRSDHLKYWQDFSREQIELHECDGEHADMLNAGNIVKFERQLSKVLAARGI